MLERTLDRRLRAARSLCLLTCLLIACLSAVLTLGQTSAGASEDRGTKVVKGSVTDGQGGPPVEGVPVQVTTTDFDETVESDANGQFTIEVPIPDDLASITIALDPDSFPDGVSMREGALTSVTCATNIGGDCTAVFRVGASSQNTLSAWEQIPGLVYSGLLFGVIMALGALGLSMIFGTTGLTNFAHGELLTFGALATYFISTNGVPFLLAVPLAVILGMGFGWLQDTALWRPLRKRGIGLIAAMIVTIGLQFFLRNLYAYITGSRTTNYQDFNTEEGRNAFGLFDYNNRDLVIAAICIIVLAAVLLALSRTRLGRATRAVSDNPALAASTGINVDRVISTVWIVGSGLAALSGAFIAFQLQVTYQIGQLTLLLLFAAVTVGGLGSIWGAVLGSLIIGVLIDLSTLVIPPELKNGGALFLLIIILLVRPQGLLGRRERVG